MRGRDRCRATALHAGRLVEHAIAGGEPDLVGAKRARPHGAAPPSPSSSRLRAVVGDLPSRRPPHPCMDASAHPPVIHQMVDVAAAHYDSTDCRTDCGHSSKQQRWAPQPYHAHSESFDNNHVAHVGAQSYAVRFPLTSRRVRHWFRLRPLVVDGVVVACMHGGSNANSGSQEATEHRARVDRDLPARMPRA